MPKSEVSIIPLVKLRVYADVHDERTCLQLCLICVFSRVVEWSMTEMWQTHAAAVTYTYWWMAPMMWTKGKGYKYVYGHLLNHKSQGVGPTHCLLSIIDCLTPHLRKGPWRKMVWNETLRWNNACWKSLSGMGNRYISLFVMRHLVIGPPSRFFYLRIPFGSPYSVTLHSTLT